MVDPSMDKQELYVAASRSREETYLYATPEIQAHREEIAPESPHLREGIPHIAEAAERDRAQLAAHEVALRSQFSGLPAEELVARREDLSMAAHREASAEAQRNNLQERADQAREGFADFDAQRARTEVLPRRQRGNALTKIDRSEARYRERIAGLEAEMRELPEPGNTARRELAVADRVLAERLELTNTAARFSPPTYIRNELGERPSDLAKRQIWDRGVAQIEGYRQKHGVKDPNRALGRESKRGAERARQQAALRRLHQAQRALGLGQHAARARQLGRGLSIGR